MNVTALSTSAALRQVIDGPLRDGVAIGRRHIAFDRYVISLTPPGGAKMPNGIEVEVEATAGQRAEIGNGRLILDRSAITPGHVWDPVPRVGLAAGPAQAATGLLDLVGCGPGLTPAGDDLLAGYIAGLVLFHRMQRTAQRLAAQAAPLTTGLSSTLLFHASRGEVPEPVHSFLAQGDAAPLLGFGHSSGLFWLVGLGLAGAPVGDLAPAGKESFVAA
jgi:Protein of unknown function (DUF2877)